MIVCAATNNAGKLKELRRILTRCGHEVKRLRPKPFARQPACPPWRMIPACAWMP